MRPNMLRGAMLGLLAPLVLLAACEMKAGKDVTGGNDMASLSIGEDGNVSITANDGAEGVAVSLPGFEGKMKIPGLQLGGENLDVGGMELYPGSAVKGIDVTDQKGSGNSRVEIRFTSPAPPDKVAAYYAKAAPAKDFSDVNVASKDGVATFTARESDGDDVTIVMNPAPDGTTAGQIVIRGQK